MLGFDSAQHRAAPGMPQGEREKKFWWLVLKASESVLETCGFVGPPH